MNTSQHRKSNMQVKEEEIKEEKRREEEEAKVDIIISI
jgi:hypothetical protein